VGRGARLPRAHHLRRHGRRDERAQEPAAAVQGRGVGRDGRHPARRVRPAPARPALHACRCRNAHRTPPPSSPSLPSSPYQRHRVRPADEQWRQRGRLCGPDGRVAAARPHALLPR
jgi:hypothetical protein